MWSSPILAPVDSASISADGINASSVHFFREGLAALARGGHGPLLSATVLIAVDGVAMAVGAKYVNGDVPKGDDDDCFYYCKK